MYQCGTDGKTIHKKGDPHDPWMDWCLGTIFWTHCEDWHLSHCNSRTERPISKSSFLSTSIRRRFEWATLSVKTWVPGTEKCFLKKFAGAVAKRCWNRTHPNKCQKAIEWSTSSWHEKGSFSGLSTNWAEYFADEKQTLTDQPSSSSFTWTPSSSWWDSSNWDSWNQRNWQDDKWADNG